MTNGEIDKKLIYLKNLVGSFKDNVERCDIAGTTSDFRQIGTYIKDLKKNTNITRLQEEDIENLDRESILAFRRLVEGKHCECSPTK